MKQRLRQIIALIPQNAKVIADVGVDHGIVVREIRRRLPLARVVAADINPGPLTAARDNLAKWGIGGVEFILTDGFANLPREVDTVVIAGMGGETIAEILENGIHNEIFAVLQPMTKYERMITRIAPFIRPNTKITEYTVTEGRRTYRVYTAELKRRPEEKYD